MRRALATTHMLIIALLVLVQGIGPAHAAPEIRKLGVNDFEVGEGTVTSPGGKVVTRINGSNIMPDNTLPAEKLRRSGAAPADNQVPAYDNATGGVRWVDQAAGGGGGSANDNASLLTTGILPAARLGDNSVTSDKLATDNTGTFNFSGPVSTPDPGDGYRRISMRSNTAYTCAVGENSALVYNGRLAYCDNGALKSFTVDNTFGGGTSGWSAVYTDNLNRANETPLASPWLTSVGSGMKLLNNVAANTSGSYDYSLYNGSPAAGNDQRITVKALGTLGAGFADRVLLLRSDDTNTTYISALWDAGTGFHLYRSGVEISTGYNQSLSAGDNVVFGVEGTTVTLSVNGAQKFSVTNASIHASGKPGIGTNASAGTAAWDDVLIEDKP
jgi:hypothetical protein